MLTFDSKDFNASATVQFDFSNEIVVEDITLASISISVSSGWDNSPGKVLSGPPRIGDGVVSQDVVGGIPNTIYRITCTVTSSSGKILSMPVHLPVSGYESQQEENYLTNA